MARLVQTYGRKAGLARPGQVYCLSCGKPVPCGDTLGGVMECLPCRLAKAGDCVVFDRDRGIGELPANLRRLVEE